MRRERYKELLGFLAVARERSFTKAAAQLEALTALREKPAGTIRITTAQHAADGILSPAFALLVEALRH